MQRDTLSVSLRGKQIIVPAIHVCGTVLFTTGKLIKIAKIHDEAFLEFKKIADPINIIEILKKTKDRPDIFTFAQKVPDITPHYPFLFEWENVAAASIGSYKSWFESQIDRSVKKHVRKSQREGIVTKIALFDDRLVEGICSIYNEQRYRQGKPFWHYGKTFEEVKQENGTYLDRIIFLGAYLGEELIGFIKFVVDGEVGTLMQIVSKTTYFSKRPTNALISKAVEICESHGIKYLLYGKHTYAKKKESSLIDFKEKNGFKKIDYPRYYVPLTTKGKIAIKYRIYKGWQNLLPYQVMKTLVTLRSKYYLFRMGKSGESNQPVKEKTGLEG